VLTGLLQRLQHRGIHATVVDLDQGFGSGAVIRRLRQQLQAALIACPIRGKPGGTRARCQGSRSHRTASTFGDGTRVDRLLVATLVPDNRDHQRRKGLLFVVLDLAWTPPQLYQQ
jgi:hypothetical protein